MTAKILDGLAVAKQLQQKIFTQIQELIAAKKRIPALTVIIVGENPASKIYVHKKRNMCLELGILSHNYDLPATVSETELLNLITKLNNDIGVDGILIQLPLPPHINKNKILESIRPDKDVDGFHPYNIGRLLTGNPLLRPCTPKGIITLLQSTGVALPGQHAIIIGASNIVGKPMAIELINQRCTVTICNSITKNLAGLVKQADIVVAAAGRAHLVSGAWIKPGAIVIDVGINRLADGKLVGDVDFAAASRHASWITPVPGGVGPMTVITLMENTLYAATKIHRI
jgi:methylenetetrahydrofolate dehydrogenase (NADP+)/methenyltetrahydrofolate cyclohydrolase